MIGPDEYHEPVDDNAFTNVLARWNLRRRGGPGRRRRARARALAGASPTRSSTATTAASGIYEQFAGFFDLEPLVIEEIAPRRPIAADLLLGAERTAGRAGAEAGRRADAPPPAPGRGRAGLARPEPRLLRAADRARQLALAGDPRGPARPRGHATGRRSKPLRIAARTRPRRPHRQHRRRSAPRDDGRPLAGARLRLRAASGRAASACSSIRGCRPSGTRSSSRSASAATASAAHRSRRRDRRAVVAGAIRHSERPLGGGTDMKKVLAALDNSLAGKPVVAAPRAGCVLDARGGGGPRADRRRPHGAQHRRGSRGSRCGPSRGQSSTRLVEAGEADDVVALVIGARGTPAGRRPLGGTAAAVATRCPSRS